VDWPAGVRPLQHCLSHEGGAGHGRRVLDRPYCERAEAGVGEPRFQPHDGRRPEGRDPVTELDPDRGVSGSRFA
jgi:hypothetical protein